MENSYNQAKCLEQDSFFYERHEIGHEDQNFNYAAGSRPHHRVTTAKKSQSPTLFSFADGLYKNSIDNNILEPVAMSFR